MVYAPFDQHISSLSPHQPPPNRVLCILKLTLYYSILHNSKANDIFPLANFLPLTRIMQHFCFYSALFWFSSRKLAKKFLSSSLQLSFGDNQILGNPSKLADGGSYVE